MTPTEKCCTTCKVTKPVDDFYKNKATKDGLYSRCKVCHYKGSEAWREKNRETVNEIARRSRERNPEAAKASQKLSNKKAYDADPEKFRALSKVNREKNKDALSIYHKEYRAKNADKKQEYAREYYMANTLKFKVKAKARAEEKREELKPFNCERAMRYAAKKKGATPAWGDLAAIQKFYVDATNLSAATGTPYHVDHMVPLQSKLVCGLHVEYNLQILGKSANQSKGNRHWPDQW